MARNKSEEAPLHDEFENPQAGPIGLHRGDRSLAARLLPYLVTLIVAVALAFCAWLWMSGKGREFFMGSSTSSSQTASSTGASAGTSSEDSSDSSSTSSGSTSQDESDTKSDSGTDSDSSSSDSDADSSSDSTSTKDDKDSASDDADSSKDDEDSSDSSAADTGTQIVVYNGLTSSPSGFAAGKASKLKSAGYTNVSAKNLQNSAPSANVVWYKTAADEATAKAVAAKLGISQTHLAPKLAVSVGVIYVSQ